MSRRPHCVKCQTDFRPEKNGIKLIEMDQDGPYKIWDGDCWKCPGCGFEIVVGFGLNPWYVKTGKSIEAKVEELNETDRVEYNYEKPQT